MPLLERLKRLKSELFTLFERDSARFLLYLERVFGKI